MTKDQIGDVRRAYTTAPPELAMVVVAYERKNGKRRCTLRVATLWTRKPNSTHSEAPTTGGHMPPLPPVPGVIRIALKGTVGPFNWVNVLHFTWSGTPPTSTVLNRGGI